MVEPSEPDSVLLEHPSISRLHALLAYDSSQDSWHLQDLQSTHGTYLNKQKVLNFTRVEEGDLIEFGFSTRQYVLSAFTEEAQQD